MITYVVGFKPADEKWQQMKAVWDACEEARVMPPAEVMSFFEHEAPDPAGVKVEGRKLGDCVQPWTGESASGYEIHVRHLPRDVTIIRVYDSW